MNLKRKLLCQMTAGAVALSALVHSADAASFNFQQGDLLMGFRLTNSPVNDVVIDVGSITTFISQAPGTTVNVGGYSPSQLVSDSFNNYNKIAWSTFGWVNNNNFSPYPRGTVWITSPRPNVGTPATPPARLNGDDQFSTVGIEIQSIIAGAIAIQNGVSSNADNTPTFVQEVIASANSQNLGVFISGTADTTTGTFKDNWQNSENGTGTSFPSIGVIRNDLYEFVGADSTDPNSGLSGFVPYYVGYFQLGTNGVVTFTRAPDPVLPAPVITVTRNGNASTISFTSTNSPASYKLFYTNSTGLTAPVATWPSPTTTIQGDGLVDSFTDTTPASATNRFYRVLAQ